MTRFSSGGRSRKRRIPGTNLKQKKLTYIVLILRTLTECAILRGSIFGRTFLTSTRVRVSIYPFCRRYLGLPEEKPTRYITVILETAKSLQSKLISEGGRSEDFFHPPFILQTLLPLSDWRQKLLEREGKGEGRSSLPPPSRQRERAKRGESECSGIKCTVHAERGRGQTDKDRESGSGSLGSILQKKRKKRLEDGMEKEDPGNCAHCACTAAPLCISHTLVRLCKSSLPPLPLGENGAKKERHDKALM